MHYLVKYEKPAIWELVTDKMSLTSISQTDIMGNTCLHIAAQSKATYALIGILFYKLEKAFNTLSKTLNNNGENCLHIAVQKGKLIFIKELFTYLSSTDIKELLTAQNNKKNTALAYVSEKFKKTKEFLEDYKKFGGIALSKEFLDDSSEEEDLEEYDIASNLKDFKKRITFETKPIVEMHNVELSFITHAVGIYLFYSPNVQRKYYEIKKI